MWPVRPDSAGNRARIAAVVSAWDTAKHYHEEDVKIRQEAKGLGIPRPLPHTDRSAMLRAVEQAKGTEIGEKGQPSTEYIAMILEEIEQDEIAAHSLEWSSQNHTATSEREVAGQHRRASSKASHRS